MQTPDPDQTTFPVHNRHSKKVVALNRTGHLLLIGIGANADNLSRHHITNAIAGVGRDQITQRQDAGEMALPICYIEAVNRFGFSCSPANDGESLCSTMKFLEIDVFRCHQTASRFGGIAKELGGHPPLSGTELHQKAAHHFGRQLIEQAHPVIG